MASQDNYKSIRALAEGLYKESGSRFLAKAYPVESAEKAMDIVRTLKATFHDARHHCFAYRLGQRGEVTRSSDDGEPSGTGGRPILGRIEAEGLSDILVVVVRYFGGVKLGVPGLMRAYRQAASDALSHAEIVEKTARTRFRLHFAYASETAVLSLLKALDATVCGRDYGEACSLEAAVPLSQAETLPRKLEGIAQCEAME